MFAALVAKNHHAVVVVPFVEFKSTEINPCASTYLLIYFKFGNSTVMEYQIFGVAYTVGQCLVGNINSILACCRQSRHPFGKYLVFILLFLSLCWNKTTGPVSERIFFLFIDCFLLSKSSYRSICPISLFTTHFQIKRSAGSIIIYDDFILLCIPFAGSVNNRSCIFQHWNHIRKDKRLSEHIFCGAEQSGALPSPFVFVIFEIVAVALPDCNVAIL